MNKFYIFEDYYPLIDTIKNYGKTDLIIVPGLIPDRDIEYNILPSDKFRFLIELQNDYLYYQTQGLNKEEIMEIYKRFKYGLFKLINKDSIVLEFGIVDTYNDVMVLNINDTRYNLDINYELQEMFKLI